MSGHLIILGPQRPSPNLLEAVEWLGSSGPVAVITAGWRHDEGDVEPLIRHLGREVMHLPLYRWFDEIGDKNAVLAGRYGERQGKIKAFKQVYRLQLQAAMDVLDKVEVLAEEEPELYGAEVEGAFEALRMVDTRALQRMQRIREGFVDVLNPWQDPSVKPYYDQIRDCLDKCDTLLVAGGHVAVLRNRLCFFGMRGLLHDALRQGKNIVCWSAGAMAMSEHIVLYYDEPPEGKGIPEVLDSGLGLLPRSLLFPHAKLRLNLSNPTRAAKLAQRFQPHQCITLEHGAWLAWNQKEFVNLGPPETSQFVTPAGTLIDLGGT